MGLTTTSLLNAEKFPVIVPNSLFSSQVCVPLLLFCICDYAIDFQHLFCWLELIFNT